MTDEAMAILVKEVASIIREYHKYGKSQYAIRRNCEITARHVLRNVLPQRDEHIAQLTRQAHVLRNNEDAVFKLYEFWKGISDKRQSELERLHKENAILQRRLSAASSIIKRRPRHEPETA